MTIAPQNIIANLRGMSDQQLSQYAQMHQNDPYVFPLAFQESQTRKQMRAQSQAMMVGQKPPTVVQQDVGQMAQSAMPQMPYAPMGAPAGMPQQAQPQQAQPQQAQPQQPQTKLPEEQGIGALSAKNLEGMKGGGIVEHFDEGGLSRDMAEMVLAKAKKYGIDPNIAMRMVRQESQFNPKAESKVGAAGLTQLMPDTAKEMGMSPEDRYDPEKSLEGGFKYLNKLRNQYGGDYEKALAAYNWGQGHVNKHLAKNDGTLNRTGLPKETADYLNKIMPGSTAQAAEVPSTPTAQAAQAAEVPSTPTAQAAPTLGRGEKLSSDGAYVVDAMGIPLRKANIPANPNSAAAQSQAYSGQGVPTALTPEQIESLKKLPTFTPPKDYGMAESILNYYQSPSSWAGVARNVENTANALGGWASPVSTAGKGVGLASEALAPTEAAIAEAARLKQIAETQRLTGPAKAGLEALTPEAAATRQAAEQAKQLRYLQADKDAAQAAEQRVNAGKLTSETAQGVEEGLAQAPRDIMSRQTQVANAAKGFDLVNAEANAPGIGSLLGGTNAQPTANMGTTSGFYDAGQGATQPTGTTSAPAQQALPTTGMDKNEMLLMLGLGLMGGQSPNALTNLGQAGIGALKYGQESKKDAADTAYKQAMAAHYGVPTEVQMLEWLKDPANMAQYKQLQESKREPMTKEKMFSTFMSSPMAQTLPPEQVGTAFDKYLQSVGPSLGYIPPNVTVTPVK